MTTEHEAGDATDLPAMIDVRDNLAAARRSADDADVAETAGALVDRLETFAERDGAGRQSVLDEVENELLRLEERTDGETERYIRASRNRIGIYRDARADADDAVVPTGSSVDLPPGESTLADAAPAAGEATVELTVVNEGETRQVDVLLAFEDEEGDVLDVVGTDGGTLEANGETTVTVETEIPDAATAYEVWARGHERASR